MVSNSKRLEIAVLSIVCATLVSESVWAQITPDATLGAESSQVTPNAELRRADKQGQRADLIDGGARRGANLFHSFSEFNVGDGQRVYFANPDGIANILSRVTGTDVSDINGTLGVDGTANLFFLNPNGIRFGPNARLDVQGSFMATTGDSFLFSDGFAFGSTNPQAPPLLTVSAPVGVQYGGRIPGAIDISSGLIRLDEPNQFDYEGLDVLQGNSLLFLGGDINLTKGKLSAPGGRIELGGLAEAGMVGLQSNGQIFSLTFPSTSALSNITLTEGARVAVIGDGGGSIAVNANNLTASGGGRFVAGTGGVGDSRDVQINVQDRASFDGRQIINGESISSGVYNEVWKDAEGQGGNIFISTGSLSLTNGANLSTSTYGQGNAGDIVINARDRVSFDGGYADGIFFPSMALANVGEDPEKKFGRRQGGNIRITTGSLLLTDGGQLQTILDGSGNAGNIIINARDRISFNDGYVVEDEFFPSAAFNGIDTGGSGSAGDIRINTDRLFLGNGGGLIAYTFGEGDAGDIIIDAPNQILLDGGQIVNDVFFRTAVLSNVEDNGHGHGGNLRIRTRLLSVSHGAILETSTYGRGDTGNIVIDARNRVSFDGGQIVNDTFYRSAATSDVGKNARGQGGIIRINAGFLNITNGAGLFANINPRGRGNAGEIRIDANQISMDQSDILTNVRLNANGNAGRINILTDSLSLTSGAHVSSSSFGQGNAGSITIHANDSIQFDGQGKDLTVLDKIKIYVSGIFSNVEPQGQGTAGNISITTEDFLLTNGGRITSRNFANRRAGNVTVNADSLRLIDGAIDTEASVSDGGNIALHSQDLLLMLNQSSITSNANTERFKGNGGNISIGSAFIVADPASNNDITANAFEGSGGNVSIDSIGLFGIQPANQPISGISDITASSTLGVQGIVEINTPNLDPSQGLVELPTTVVDASRQINQTCPTGVTADELSRFVRSGRSGLPSTPTDPLTSQEITSEWYTPTSETPNQTTAALPSDRPDPLIEAQGWVKYPDGSVEMVAAASTSDPPSPAFISVSCHD